MRARLLILVGSVLASGVSGAGPWSLEPRLGLASNYASNPDLRPADENAETHEALLLDVPIRYDLDAMRLSLIPRARYSDSSGYASLASNYFHLDASAQFTGERGSTALAAGWARDSSLYHSGESVNGIGVRRDTSSADLDWQRYVTARAQVQLDLSWTRVNYDQGSAVTSLVDNRYISASPALSFAVSELNTLKIIGSAGQYESLDGTTSSKDISVQLGLDRQLNELWSLSTSAGYSRSKNHVDFYFGPFLLGSIDSRQTGTVYSANLTRKADVFTLTASLSRALRPSGLAFLSQQDSASVHMNYVYSERWSFNAVAGWQKTLNPVVTGGDVDRRFLNADVSAAWHWTPEWTVSLHASRVEQQFGTPTLTGASTGISLEISRQFYRVEL